MVRGYQNYHMDSNGWADVGYHDLVCPHSVVFTGRGIGVVGAHADGFNTSGYGVCFIGTGDQITAAAKHAYNVLYRFASQWAGRQLTKRGHRDVNPDTACPGPVMLRWVHGGMPDPGAPVPSPAPEKPRLEDDMFMFWHKGAVYLAQGGRRSSIGIHAHDVDRMKASGVPVLGFEKDDSMFFHMMAPFEVP